MADDVLVERAFVRAHRADDHRGADVVARRPQQHGAEAAAGKADAADAAGLHVLSAGEVAKLSVHFRIPVDAVLANNRPVRKRL